MDKSAGHSNGSADKSSGVDAKDSADKVCFVVMPFAFDPMVIVDLGGMEPDEDPNPNVMYELGIRHAFGLPLVIMAWEGQHLPFDVSNQRAIMEPRDMLSIDTNRAKVTSFIKAASEGRYYRPMEAVARIATIEAASSALGEESILTALVQEIRHLKGVVASAAFPKHVKPFRQFRPTIKHAVRGKVFRKELYPHFVASGGQSAQWPHFLGSEISQEFLDAAHKWGIEEWKDYIAKRAQDVIAAAATMAPAHFEVVVSDSAAQPVAARVIVTEELIQKVRAELPEQPWPTGTHKSVRAKLGITSAMYERAVSELIRRGIYSHQVKGALIETESGDSGAIPK